MKISKKLYIQKLAEFLCLNNTTMNASDLANHLNWNNFKTKDGQNYKGKRGTYVLIKSSWKWFDKNGKKSEAQNIADAFLTKDGKYAYKK